MSKLKDLTNQKFGRLAVVSYNSKNKYGQSLWNCLCECGNKKIVYGNNLKSGHTQSCGCFQIEKVKEAQTTHGHSVGGNTSPTYHSWQQMIQRCTNPNHKHYMDYGGRGIIVCERWLDSFENFLEDMGEQPENMSIDRINNEGNYYPENCQWSTITEQQRNKRSNVHLTFAGEIKLQEDWAREWDINSGTVSYHLAQGRSIEWIYTNKVKIINYPNL